MSITVKNTTLGFKTILDIINEEYGNLPILIRLGDDYLKIEEIVVNCDDENNMQLVINAKR